MSFSKTEFDDFVQRLHFHRRGDGVNDHWTRDAIFIVQKRDRIFGIDPDYGGDDNYIWVNRDKDIDEADDRTALRLDILDNAGRDIPGGWERLYWVERWSYVSAHFTREAAEAYIARKKHDHEALRVYVECQIYCNEFNAVVDAILDGKIAFVDAGEEVSNVN